MRKTIIILICCTIVLLLGYSGYRAYELWKQNHWMTLAKKYEAVGDSQNEILCLEQAVHYNPRNADACRMLANLAEAAGSKTALVLRKKVVELDPGSLDDRVALAHTALIFQDEATVASALDGVDAAGKKTAAYLNVAGEYAMTLNHVDEARADFAESARLDPSNPAPQISLSVIQLHGTNALDMAEARITLQRVAMNTASPAMRAQAQRELILDALRSRDYNTALEYSGDLIQPANALFPDKLLRLEVLRLVKSSQYRPYLAACKNEAVTDPGKLPQMALWLMQRNYTEQALDWLQGLPSQTQANLPAALFIAQCQMVLKEWSTLQNTASKQNWGDQEFTRHAYVARAMREQGLREPSKGEWDLAVSTANNQPDKLTSLFRLAAGWNWSDEAQQILWTIVNNYPQAQWASQELSAILYENGSTRPLMQLFSVQSSRNPDDLTVKNNLALTAMLLKAQELNPYDISLQVYQKDPTNSYYACTYAFALYLQGKNSQALQIMQHIDPQALKDNSTDGYYGLILKAAGDKAQANTYLQRSLQGQLLPEERALFQQAESGL